ncbi:MAG: response regulator [Armatimonadota bacterium]
MTRALIVEDDPLFARVVSDVLNMNGMITSTAHSAVEALSLARRGAYDLALVDIALPGPIDGVEVARELKSSNSAIALILMTGRASSERIQDGIRSGAYTCLMKPCNLDDLLAVVRRVLDDRSRGCQQG